MIVTDVEGTTTPIAFVQEVLFPYARTRLAAFLAEHGEEARVRAALAETRRLSQAGDEADALGVLLRWMDEDRKAPPLKELQGLIWADGYARGELKSQVYADAAAGLRRWHEEGIRLAVYSSGSVLAQRLVFRHSDRGDLEGLFSEFFDTGVGAKQEADSYRRIVGELGVAPVEGEALFLSDSAVELDAAAEAGLATVQVVRPEDGTVASGRHPVAARFDEVRRAAGWSFDV